MSDKNLKQNKNTVYHKIPGYPGVYQIMNWSERKKKYLNKTIGNKYYAVKRVNRAQVTKTFIHLNEAKQWQLNTEVDSQKKDKMLFKAVKEMYFEKKKTEVRVATYETALSKIKHLKYFDNMYIEDITPKTIDAWLLYVKRPEYLKDQHSSRIFYKHELCELRQIFNFYSEYICEDTAYAIPVKKRHNKDSIVDKEKHDEFKMKSKRKFLSGRELRSFLKAFENRASKNLSVEEPFLLLVSVLRHRLQFIPET